MGLGSSSPQQTVDAPKAIIPKPPHNDTVINQDLSPIVLFYRYIGTGYYGLQLNPELPSIEGDLFDALIACGLLPPDAKQSLGRIHWNEASRTDAGVHACAQVLTFVTKSAKGIVCGDIPAMINSKLKEGSPIFIMSALSIGRQFQAQKWAEYRRYNYLMPIYAFHQVSKTHFEYLRTQVMPCFIGKKNYHNYTRHMPANSESAYRHITEFSFSEPFKVEGQDFVLFTITGQSFMLNQIRKMLAVVLAASYGQIEPKAISETLSQENWRLNKVPGEGLMLDKVGYPSTMKPSKKRPDRDPKRDVEFECWRPSIEEWKHTVLFKHIATLMQNEGVYTKWLKDVLAMFPPKKESELEKA